MFFYRDGRGSRTAYMYGDIRHLLGRRDQCTVCTARLSVVCRKGAARDGVIAIVCTHRPLTCTVGVGTAISL